MHISNEGLDFIASEEGFRANVYNDFAGLPTIGYGHALKPGESFGTLSEADAKTLLRIDVAVAEAHVNRLVRVALTQDQFDALCSFVFNLGGAALAGSTLLRLLNQGEYER